MPWASGKAAERYEMHMGRITAKGQITIPAELRKRLGIRAGTRINWIEEKGRLVLVPMTARGINEIMGFLKPKPGEPSAFEELFKERAQERREKILKRRSTRPSSRERRPKQRGSSGAIATLFAPWQSKR
jgi:AbrB family looped-hinge helix DNA binding protein